MSRQPSHTSWSWSCTPVGFSLGLCGFHTTPSPTLSPLFSATCTPSFTSLLLHADTPGTPHCSGTAQQWSLCLEWERGETLAHNERKGVLSHWAHPVGIWCCPNRRTSFYLQPSCFLPGLAAPTYHTAQSGSPSPSTMRTVAWGPFPLLPLGEDGLSGLSTSCHLALLFPAGSQETTQEPGPISVPSCLQTLPQPPVQG